MDMDYIIVQAGGKGTRMEQLTANKPKALVPVANLPMLFHLFRQYPDKKFIIIADYKADVMRKYLAAFAKVSYLIVDAKGKKGTCAGIDEAMARIPMHQSFLLVWSDLVLADKIKLPVEEGNYIGLSQSFPCRWCYEHGQLEEINSERNGVAGWFLFPEKEILSRIPAEGEFVRWLQQENIAFEPLNLTQTKEYGLRSVYEQEHREQAKQKCRPFNSLQQQGNVLIKKGIDEQGKKLAVIEKEWYRFVQEFGFEQIPHIYELEPDIKMECVTGGNIYEYGALYHDEKRKILKKVITTLQSLHQLGTAEADYFSIWDTYVKKTWDRLTQIRDLVPFADCRTITINGKSCRNVFFYQEQLEELFAGYSCEGFTVIHGDNTFSNMLLDKQNNPVLIDPRGYFGTTKIYGDPVYDWAKLYYSLVGNYDQFNRRNFHLTIGKNEVTLEVASNGFEDLKKDFFELLADEVNPREIQLIHAVIWLSLTTYAWEDYDSICGAFYNGLYYLADVWND